jgi:hypothetical protein
MFVEFYDVSKRVFWDIWPSGVEVSVRRDAMRADLCFDDEKIRGFT